MFEAGLFACLAMPYEPVLYVWSHSPCVSVLVTWLLCCVLSAFLVESAVTRIFKSTSQQLDSENINIATGLSVEWASLPVPKYETYSNLDVKVGSLHTWCRQREYSNASHFECKERLSWK